MTGNTSIQVVDDIEKAQQAADWKRFADLHAENVTLQTPDSPTPLKGREAVVNWYKGFFSAFPDLKPHRNTAISQGEWVAAEYTVTGTHKGPLHGPGGTTIPPTHKRISIANSSWYRVKDGKIVEVHEYFDQAGFLAQLGLGPK
jgi:steroid delta-isomerase-like uncharacterized protein